jgi:hypothetical protein
MKAEPQLTYDEIQQLDHFWNRAPTVMIKKSVCPTCKRAEVQPEPRIKNQLIIKFL